MLLHKVSLRMFVKNSRKNVKPRRWQKKQRVPEGVTIAPYLLQDRCFLWHLDSFAFCLSWGGSESFYMLVTWSQNF